MVHTCVVSGCRNRRTPGSSLSFYRFPRDPDRKRRWITAVNRQGWKPNDGSRLCSTHFISGKQVKNPRSPDYVPSVFSTAALNSDMKEPCALELQDKQEAQVEAANALLFLQSQGRCQVGERHESRRLEEAAVEDSSSSSLSTEEDDDDDDDNQSASNSKKGRFTHRCDVQVNFDDILKALKKENQALRESVEKMSLSENSLRNDAEKVKFYTGLPNYYVLETVMWLLAPHMDGIKNMKLSKFQQLLLTLMRLRLDLRNQDLAYRFGVKVGTVTRTVHRMVNIMSSTLVPTAVFWPSRAELRKNLPAALHSSHPDCVVIVDCFTVPFEEPVFQGSQQHRVASSSQGIGTSHNVLKYLIGVAPQGVVTFVSRGALGNVSDKCLAEGCGLLCKLLPGDVVLASRDLDICESVAARGAVFQISSNYSDKGEAHGMSESSAPPEASADTATVHDHVEKVISMVKQRYTMLTGPVESPFTTASERTSNLSTFDKIVQVACALNNLCISAAPLE
ncbi:uncharacterized protein LOC117525241 [Thalassophryne amazonica]|uniref:uncharacterized protein LOC117525241 n=1 Tax=Thalassophryne amazonica TaxID=390379 RepID=UPI0014715524|nr:uncharacterized protein LOC117525241 [Thalassophryne amazonica]